MSCTKCKSDPCACADHGLTTPCSYDDCTQPSESCEEVVCAECVSYCGPYFQVTDPSSPTDIQFNVYTGDRLEEILQRIALYMVDPACADPQDHHSVWHVQLSNITNDGVTISWNGVASQSVGLNIYWSITSGVWVLANTAGILPTTITSYNITNLQPATEYLFKVTSGDDTQATTLSVVAGGTTYVDGTLNVPTIGGSGDGLLTVDITCSTSPGPITGAVVNTPGSGYAINDVLIVDGGTGDATVQVIGVTLINECDSVEIGATTLL